VDDAELRRRFAASPVARLATVRPDGSPHVVPVTFAVREGNIIYSVVDAKPKRTTALQRIANLRAEPRCALLVDHYEDDWSALWWVRADGVGKVIDAPAADHEGLLALTRRYSHYRTNRPTGPLLTVTVTRWSGWAGR
jgi:PPOX class probable F420-dependent enzyme